MHTNRVLPVFDATRSSEVHRRGSRQFGNPLLYGATVAPTNKTLGNTEGLGACIRRSSSTASYAEEA